MPATVSLELPRTPKEFLRRVPNASLRHETYHETLPHGRPTAEPQFCKTEFIFPPAPVLFI